MTIPPDWKAEVRRRARALDTVLPEAMVEEIAQHLEDLHASALEAGAAPEAARQQAMRALLESPITPLVPHAVRRAPPT